MPSVPVTAGRDIGARMVLLLTHFMEWFDLKHFGQGVEQRHRYRLQIRRIIGTSVDLTALYHRLVHGQKDKHWNAPAIENAFWTFFLKRTYGSKKIDRVLGGRAIDTKTELVRRKVGKKGKVCTNFELNVGFFETHELKLETLGNTLRRCAENPNDVFPGWVKDRKWHDVLRLYVARRSKVTEKAETPAMIGGAASTAADEEDDKTIVQNPMMEVGEEDEEDDVDSAQAVEAEQPEEAAAVVAVAASDRLHIQAAAAAADCYMSKPVDIATGIVECFRAIERRDFGATSAALERVLSLNNSTGIQSDVRLIASMVMDMHPRACDSEEVHQLLAQEDVPAMSTVKELDMAHELAMHLRDAWPGFDSDFP